MTDKRDCRDDGLSGCGQGRTGGRCIDSVSLYLTNDCNLRCGYCFVHRDGRSISIETAKEAVDFLLSRCGDNMHPRMSFFGGEPMLQMPLLREIVAYGRHEAAKQGKGISFALTTNGTLIDKEAADFFWENDVVVLFSWDGDRQRITASKGEAAYENMLSSVKILTGKGFRLAARMTISPDDIRIDDFFRHAAEVGFECVVAVGMNESEEWTEEKAERLYSELEKNFIECMRHGGGMDDSILTAELMQAIGLMEVVKRPCEAGLSLVSIDVEGKIYPCQYPWPPEMMLGDVQRKGLEERKRAVFEAYTQEDSQDCEGCVAAKRCRGSCFELSYKESGVFSKQHKPLCMLSRARYRAAERILDALYRKQKDAHFLRWVLRKNLVDLDYQREIAIPAGRTGDYEGRADLKEISFRFSAATLDQACGAVILSFIRKAQATNPDLRLVKPVPPCVLRADQLWGIPGGGDCAYQLPPYFGLSPGKAGGGGDDGLEKRRRILLGLYEDYTRMAKIPEKCLSCVYRMRNMCSECYFGLD